MTLPCIIMLALNRYRTEVLRNSRMRLAKGFFLPVFVAQISDLSLPSTIGPSSDRHCAGIGPRFSGSFFRRNNNFSRLFQLYEATLESFGKKSKLSKWQNLDFEKKNSRMRLAKGFFLPVFVAQIGDLPLPCTIGPASERHLTQVLPSLFGEEKLLFRLLLAFFDRLKVF